MGKFPKLKFYSMKESFGKKSRKFVIRKIYKTELSGKLNFTKIIKKWSKLGHFSKNGKTNYNNFYFMKLRNL